MKKSLKLAALMLSCAALLASCGGETTSKPSASIDGSTTVEPTTSQETSVPGTTTSIEENINVVGISLSEAETVDCDFTKALEVTILPENATNKKVTWSSENKDIATVDETGLVYGVKNGTTFIKAKSEDGGYEAKCEVTVSGYHKAKDVWGNIGKIENNTPYNTEAGDKDFEIITDNEEYTEVRFNRSTTREWASFKCWYNQIEATSLDLDVELVQGLLPAFLIEFSGEVNFKQFWRVPLTVGERTKVSYNITDLNIKTGKDSDGSWGFLFFEFDNPFDGSDTNANTDTDVILRIHKCELRTDTAKKPDVVSGLVYNEELKKLVFNKDMAASNYLVDVVKVEGATETPLNLASQITRFKAIENIPGMKLSFTPKTEENFANTPGTYKARIKASNSVGEADYCEYIQFTIPEPGVESKYKSENFANNGEAYPNIWNVNKTYSSKLVEKGLQISFTGQTKDESSNTSWDAMLLDFDKTQIFTKFYIDFEVISSATPLINVGIQFNDYAETEPENSDGKQQNFFDLTGKTGLIHLEFDITADLSKGLGNVGLMFDRTSNLGDVVIVIESIGLVKKDAQTSAYVATNFLNNGAITPNQWNTNKTYASTLTDTGYKLTLTSSSTAANASWDAFILDFDKTVVYSKLSIDFEITKSAKHLSQVAFQFNDYAETEPENSDGKQQEWLDVSSLNGTIHHEFNITADLSKGIGTFGLMFDRTEGLGDIEIMVYSISLIK